MINNITSTAMSLNQAKIELEVGARLAKTAKDSLEAEGVALLELLDSANLDPDLGNLIDILA